MVSQDKYLNYKELYYHYLPIFFSSTTLFGFLVGFTSAIGQNLHPTIIFTISIGYSGLGMITGITYPISYPLLTSYVLYKTRKYK